MATYPNTALAEGAVDEPFGGQPANLFGTLRQTYWDACIREAERQLVQALWTGRPLQYWRIVGGGLAGDAIVFDTTGDDAGALAVYRTLASITYDPDVYPIVGMLISPVSNNTVGPVSPGGGHLAQSVTGLATGTGGALTIDTTTGRLRARGVGEPTNGFADKRGNAFLLPLGVLP